VRLGADRVGDGVLWGGGGGRDQNAGSVMREVLSVRPIPPGCNLKDARNRPATALFKFT
jgi:hypothetical protein